MLGVSTMLFGLAAAAPQPHQPLHRATTQKTFDAFGSCFTGAQEKARRAWAFMPTGDGGTFTNSGASHSGGTYWLSVHGSADAGEIRLFGEAGARLPQSLIEAVDQCR